MKNLAWIGLVVLIGCGDDDGGPTDASMPADAPMVDSGMDATTTDAGGDDAGGEDDASVADGGETDAPPFDASGATATLSDVGVYANCMPIVAPDPIIAFWNVAISGAAGPTATLVSARLTITGASTVTQNLTVDMPVVALTAGSGSAMQRKVASDTNPSEACGELCSGATFVLELEYDTLGGRITARHEDMFGCVY